MAAQNRNCKVKRLALMGLLFALAMALSFLESLLPALPMLPPGIRLGLSNIVTMYALFVLGPVSGYTNGTRAWLQGGGEAMKKLGAQMVFATFLVMLSTAALTVTVMLLLSLLPGIRRQYLLLSVFGGAAHNVGQLIAARFIISNQYVWYYLPVLLAAGLLMGAITGMALRVVMPYLDRLSLK